MIRLAEMVAGIKELPLEQVAQQIYENSLNFFQINKRGNKLTD